MWMKKIRKCRKLEVFFARVSVTRWCPLCFPHAFLTVYATDFVDSSGSVLT